MFAYPNGMAIDQKNGLLFVCDTNNHVIRKIDLLSEDYHVTTIAGKPPGLKLFHKSKGKQYPSSITLSNDGRIFVSDSNIGCIYQIDGNRLKYRLGHQVTLDKGVGGLLCHEDNLHFTVQSRPAALVIADTKTWKCHIIGSEPGYANGSFDVCLFNNPTDVAMDYRGNLYVADHSNNCIRKVNLKTKVVSWYCYARKPTAITMTPHYLYVIEYVSGHTSIMRLDTPWLTQRLMWIALFKNQNNNECYLSKLPRDVLMNIIVLVGDNYPTLPNSGLPADPEPIDYDSVDVNI